MANKQQPEFNHYQDAAPEYTESILWHRIYAVAGVTALVVITLVGLGIWLFQLQTEQQVPAHFDVQQLPITHSIPEHVSERGMVESEEIAQTQVLAVAEADAKEEPLTATNSTQESTSIKPATASKTKPSTTANATAEPAQQESDNPKSAQTELAEQKPQLPDNDFKVVINILNQDISTATLTETMQGLEPVNPIQNTDSLNANFIKLYFYTDLNGRAGDTLTYTWLRNGKKVARVRIPVGSDRWRSHASKNISKNMRGDWQVIVTDKKGKELATTHFSLKSLNNS